MDVKRTPAAPRPEPPRSHRPGPAGAAALGAVGEPQRRWNAGRLASLLNMAAPKDFTPGVNLIAPGLSLALRAPLMPPTGDTHIDVTGRTGDVVSTAATPDELAWEMVGALGDGTAISLADAQRALVVPDPDKLQNDADRIAEYFGRVDTDSSGGLDQAELSRLFAYYREHQDDDPRHGPKLPPTWA